MALNNRSDDWWKDHFWDLRAERTYGWNGCYDSQTEVSVSVKVPKEGFTESIDIDEAKTSNPA